MRLFHSVSVLALTGVLFASALPSAFAGIDTEATGHTFSAGIQKRQYAFQERISVDNEVRYLGGGAMPVDRDSVQTFMRPTMKFPFSVNNHANLKGNPVLTIGLIQGVNTQHAHEIGQSNQDHVSSPVVVKLNGQKIGYIEENGEDVRLDVPAGLLNKDGNNILQVQTGTYLSAPNTIAYDTIQIQDIAVEM